MTTATDLWAAVEANYEVNGLITLTNIRDRGATAINLTAGVSAAQHVLDLWAIHTQVAYAPTTASHVAVALQAVIAVLWRRGGSASAIEQVKWDEVFGPEGLLSKIKRTGPRGRMAPSTNSGVQPSSDFTQDGQATRPWSDPKSLPLGLLPQRRTAES